MTVFDRTVIQMALIAQVGDLRRSKSLLRSKIRELPSDHADVEQLEQLAAEAQTAMESVSGVLSRFTLSA